MTTDLDRAALVEKMAQDLRRILEQNDEHSFIGQEIENCFSGDETDKRTTIDGSFNIRAVVRELIAAYEQHMIALAIERTARAIVEKEPQT